MVASTGESRSLKTVLSAAKEAAEQKSPVGTIEKERGIQPSLRDSSLIEPHPSTSCWAIFLPSLAGLTMPVIWGLGLVPNYTSTVRLASRNWGTRSLLEVWIQNGHQSRVSHIWRALCARCGAPQISSLRWAPVEMTKLGLNRLRKNSVEGFWWKPPALAALKRMINFGPLPKRCSARTPHKCGSFHQLHSVENPGPRIGTWGTRFSHRKSKGRRRGALYFCKRGLFLRQVIAEGGPEHIVCGLRSGSYA